MKKALLFYLVVAVVRFGSSARADIAATEYVGQGITPVDAPTIRMVSAKVDIVWGEPGTLSAVFVMNNEAAEAAEVQLGFPVSLPNQFRHKDKLDFTMAFDGVPIDRASVRQDSPSKNENGVPYETVWFHCRYLFPPGATTVKVDTKLPATAAYRLPFRENLFYRIDTGAGWKGPIGSEKVAIHFLRPLRSEDIEESKPPGAILDGDTVRWHFENFEPDGHDHDIALKFLNPCVLPILDDLRRQVDKAPHDRRKRLNLIRHLLGLCDVGRWYPYPREEMPRQEWEEMLAMLPSDADRARFQEWFIWQPDGRLEQTGAGPEVSDEVIAILSAVGYVPRFLRSTFLIEGRELLAQFLKEYPHDAEAWNIDLLHYVGYPSEVQFYEYQMERIAAARKNCPGDPTIRLWFKLGFLSLMRQVEIDDGSDGPNLLDRQQSAKQRQLDEQLTKRGFYKFRFKQFSYSYAYSG